ncbi:hypothetical protein CU098_013732 [Rhizopus stolonifer]|uniref:SH3 domain-containing protein n=1 Tax=Rhizopus stolonifer TaxID=4846 RepID=A0A367KXV3_RHIST|nr:hypothetical protein CU098_013732 [Rhizopus stolonifer]
MYLVTGRQILVILYSQQYFDYPTFRQVNNVELSHSNFTVLDPMTVNGIRININSWFGKSGGLGYVQIYHEGKAKQRCRVPIIYKSMQIVDAYLYPTLNSGNSSCQGGFSSKTAVTGNWEEVYVYGYYQAVLESKTNTLEPSTGNTSITYQPYIPSYGQYKIYATTPGCVGSSNCYKRTQVEYQLQLQPGQITTFYSDQNVFEDTRTLIYSGPVGPISESFKPSITLRPAFNATRKGNVVIMADTMDFIKDMSLNPPIISILEYNLTLAKNVSAVSWGPLKQQLPLISTVYSIDSSSGDTLYIGGEFINQNSSNSYNNIVAYEYQSGFMVPLADTGLNGKVSKLLSHTISTGEFNATSISNTNLHYVAQYDLQRKTWLSLEGGVNGPVNELFLTANNTLSLSGFYNCQFSSMKQCIKSGGSGQWDIIRGTWVNTPFLLLGNIEMVYSDALQTVIVGNQLNAETYQANMVNLNSSRLATSLFDHQTQFYPTTITAGTMTEWNATIVAGHFTDGNITRILISNNSSGWTLVDEFQGQVYHLAEYHQRLYVGGNFRSDQSVSFTIYDLTNNTKISTHSVLDNSNPGTVTSIRAHPDGKSLLIGGNFSRINSLSCNAICMLDFDTLKWSPVAMDLSGVVYDIAVSENNDVVVLGDLHVQNSNTHMATLKNQASTWEAYGDVYFPGNPTNFIKGTTSNTFIVAGSSKSIHIAKRNRATKRGAYGSVKGGFFVGMLQDKTYSSLNTSILGPNTVINQMLLVPASDTSRYFPENTQNVLLAIGDIEFVNIGYASAALYDGSTWFPYLISTQWNGQPGEFYGAVHKENFYNPKNSRRAFGLLYVLKYHSEDKPEPMPPYGRLMNVFGMAAGTGLGVTPAAAATSGSSRPRMQYQEDEGTTFVAQPFGLVVNANTLPFIPETQPFDPPVEASTLPFVSKVQSSQDNMESKDLPPVHEAQALQAATETNVLPSIPEAQLPHTAMESSVIPIVAPETQPVQDATRASAIPTFAKPVPMIFYAKFHFKAQDSGELELNEGDKVTVTDTSDDIWWLGTKENEAGITVSGVFPSNYVKA